MQKRLTWKQERLHIALLSPRCLFLQYPAVILKLSLQILLLVSISDELRNGMLYSFHWDIQPSLSPSVLSLACTINIHIILALDLNNIDQYLKHIITRTININVKKYSIYPSKYVYEINPVFSSACVWLYLPYLSNF